MSENNIPTRGAALLDAHALINGERQQAYGAPEDCFGDIAMLWNWWNGRETVTGDLVASDVTMMMALLKIARERCGAGKRDNIIDAAAYLALYEDIKQLGGGDETR